MAAGRLKRQVDSILSSLDSALDDNDLEPVPKLPSTQASEPATLTPLVVNPPSSPFSLATGGTFLGVNKVFGTVNSPFGGEVSFKSAQFGSDAVHAGVAVDLKTLENIVNATEECSKPCRPYDYSDYLKRISTFRMAFAWFDKADAIAPPQCARHGWCLGAPETLHCEVCGSYIKAPSALVSSPPAILVNEELSAIVAAQLQSSHRELCPWRGNPCPESFATLLLSGRQGALPSLPKGLIHSRQELRSRAVSLFELHMLPRLSTSVHAPLLACAQLCGYSSVDDFQAALLK